MLYGVCNEYWQPKVVALYRVYAETVQIDELMVAKPAADYYVSSRFGTRRDPLTKRWASHKALDLAGWPGTAIQAAGAGKVVRAGWWGPYGNMVEIDHGNGYRTRYGHMRRLKVKKGEMVVSWAKWARPDGRPVRICTLRSGKTAKLPIRCHI